MNNFTHDVLAISILIFIIMVRVKGNKDQTPGLLFAVSNVTASPKIKPRMILEVKGEEVFHQTYFLC